MQRNDARASVLASDLLDETKRNETKRNIDIDIDIDIDIVMLTDESIAPSGRSYNFVDDERNGSGAKVAFSHEWAIKSLPHHGPDRTAKVTRVSR